MTDPRIEQYRSAGGLPLMASSPQAVENGIHFVAKGWACEDGWEHPEGCAHRTKRAARACGSGKWMRKTEWYFDKDRNMTSGHTERQELK